MPTDSPYIALNDATEFDPEVDLAGYTQRMEEYTTSLSEYGSCDGEATFGDGFRTGFVRSGMIATGYIGGAAAACALTKNSKAIGFSGGVAGIGLAAVLGSLLPAPAVKPGSPGCWGTAAGSIVPYLPILAGAVLSDRPLRGWRGAVALSPTLLGLGLIGFRAVRTMLSFDMED